MRLLLLAVTSPGATCATLNPQVTRGCVWGCSEHMQWLQRWAITSPLQAGSLLVFGPVLGQVPRAGWSHWGANGAVRGRTQWEQAQKPEMLGERRVQAVPFPTGAV